MNENLCSGGKINHRDTEVTEKAQSIKGIKNLSVLCAFVVEKNNHRFTE